MVQNDDVKVLKFALILGIIDNFFFGLGFLLIPGTLVRLSGGNPADLSWLRWPGGALIALGIGAIMVYSKPEKKNTFVTTYALFFLLGGLGLLYSWIMHEYSGANTWFIVFPTLLKLILSALLFWGRNQAKGIL